VQQGCKYVILAPLQLNGVALDILSIRSDRHRSVEGFCHSLRVFDVRVTRETCRDVEILCVERIWNTLELLMLMNIGQEDILKRLWLSSVASPTGW